MDINELGYGPHETNVETFVGNIAFTNGTEIGLVFWWVELLVFFIKIRNYIFDCTLLGLGNLNLRKNTLGRLAINSSLIFLISGLSSIGSRMDCSSSYSASILSLEYLNKERHTFYLLMSIIISAIILLSKGSVVTLDTLRMVAPKGCLLIPSYLKFSMSKKSAIILCRLVRSYL